MYESLPWLAFGNLRIAFQAILNKILLILLTHLTPSSQPFKIYASIFMET